MDGKLFITHWEYITDILSISVIPSPVLTAPWRNGEMESDPIFGGFIDYVSDVYEQNHEEEEQVDPMEMPVCNI